MTAGAKAERKALEPIENIKARASIVEIIGPYAELRKHRDGELWAKCPLHTDRTPSFKVSPKRQSFKCFGCGAAGDVFDFIRLAEGVQVAEGIT